MSFSRTCLTSENCRVWFFNIVCHFLFDAHFRKAYNLDQLAEIYRLPLDIFSLAHLGCVLCSVAVEQPLQVMICSISVVSYDRCEIHRNFPMTCLP